MIRTHYSMLKIEMTMKRYLFATLLLATTFLMTAGCSSDDPTQITSLKLNRSELVLLPGETFQLEATTRPADAGVPITWSSSNELVVTVSEQGLVTGVGYGAAIVTARYGSYSARCSITLNSEQPWDASQALAAPMTGSLLYSRNVLLYANRRIMQGFDIAGDGSIYYSQVGSNAYTLNICRAAGPNLPAESEVMILKHFGHGTQIVAEQASDGKTYIWVNSNASVDDTGEYGNNWSISRVEFVPGTSDADGYAGDTFFLNKESQYDQQAAIDFEARRLLVGSRKSGVRYFWIFDLDEALALPLKEMTVTVTVGGGSGDVAKQTVERKIMGRDLNDCRVLGSFSFAAGTDKEHDVYSYSHQGHEICGDYVYFYEGNAVENTDAPDTFQSKAYVTVFNYNGRIVVPRTEVAAVADLAGLAAEGLTTSGYAEAESLKLRNGRLYLGLCCRNGSSSNRYANILVYDCVMGE